jgi:2-iminobutanoate/2-iminopropanoate deaminase
MPSKTIFYTEKAPAPKGPYSQAVIHNGVMYVSGQIPIDSVTGLMVKGTIEEETETALNNLKIIVEEAGAAMEDVLRVSCYLADMEDFARFNSVYKKYFETGLPARSTFQAGRLPLDVQIEIDAIVAIPEKGN